MTEKEKAFGCVASMTGYGRSSGESPAGRVTVEVRSLNHRYLEISVRAPKGIMFLEPEIRNLVRERFSRGKVELFISHGCDAPDFDIDLGRAGEVAKALREVAGIVGDTVRLEHLLAAGQILNARDPEIPEEMSQTILKTVAEALDRMLAHRRTEGKLLAMDLASRMEDLEDKVLRITGLAREVPDRVRRQMESFLENGRMSSIVDPQRLEAEIAMLAQKSDVTEEITRLNAHMGAFRTALSSGDPVGRRMDFLLQEMQREINTIGSKSSQHSLANFCHAASSSG